MRFKKLFLLLLLVLTIPVFVGCDYSINQFFTDVQGTETSVTNLSEVSENSDFLVDDYDSYPIYSSDTYGLTDVSKYNEVIYDTTDYIRHTNIEITSTFYEMVTTFPRFEEKRVDLSISSGSGFVFLEDEEYYYAITNYHVIENKNSDLVAYEVRTYGDPAFTTCDIVTYDEDLDLAVLKFLKAGHDEVEIIDITTRVYYQFSSGELVMAVGNPQETDYVVTVGEFQYMYSIGNVDYQVIYHTAQIDEGSSGGVLVDVDGNFLGVNTWGGEGEEIHSYAIPNYIVYQFLINNGVLD